MTDYHPDYRRYAPDTTSASAHPELTVGEFAGRPRFQPLLTPDDRIAILWWRRRMGGIVAILVAAGGLWTLFAAL